MERQIDFSRDRRMLCGACGHRWNVDLDWIERWEQAKEACLGCGMTCEHEDSPRVTVDPGDPTTRDFDPAALLTAETRMRMGGELRVADWAARQRAKALHLGTYEAAVQNMLRRMDDQDDHGSRFYLYRVHLKPSVVVREDWLIDPGNFAGDVVLAEVCPPGIDVTRYLDYHEIPAGSPWRLGGRLGPRCRQGSRERL